MQNPERLRVSAAAEELALLVYQYTAGFPRDERFGLTLQMRRAAVSVGSNIWQGAGRRSNKAFAASLDVSHGEACELLFQTRVSTGLEFGDPKLAAKVKSRGAGVRRMLFNLIEQVDQQRRAKQRNRLTASEASPKQRAKRALNSKALNSERSER